MTPASVLIDKATSDLLIGPDWGMNLEICDLINRDPGQAKDVIRAVKKRIGSKNPKVQLLSLTVLETLVKNCGISVHQQVAEKDVLHEMVKIVKRKTDMDVRDKILVLLDSWQEAFGGSRGRFPQFYMAYDELRRIGVDFPERAPENLAPIFTPPQTHPVSAYSAPGYSFPASAPSNLDAPVHSDVPVMSLTEIEVARGALEVLSEILNALNAGDRQALKDELIVELVSQSRSTQQRVRNLISVTSDEELLFQGLSLNDDLQRVLTKHNAIESGSPLPLEPSTRVTQNQSGQFEEEENEAEDDFSQLAHRSAKSRILSKNEEKPSGNEKPSHSNGQLALPPPPQPIKKLSPPPGHRESAMVLLSTLDTHKDQSPRSPLTPPPWVDSNVGQIVPYETFSQDESSNPFASSPPFKATPSQPLQTFPSQQDYQHHYGPTNGHSSNPLPSFSQQQNSSSTFIPHSLPAQSGYIASWSMEASHSLAPYQNIPVYSSDVQSPSPSSQSSYLTSTQSDSHPLSLEQKAATPTSGGGHVAPHLPPPPVLHSHRQRFLQQQQVRPEQQSFQYSGSAESDLVGQVHAHFDQNGSYYGQLNRKTDQQLASTQSRKPSSASSFTSSNKLFDDLVDLRSLTGKFKSADISSTLNKTNTGGTESL